ncbi:MAG: Uncharacterised protein [Acidimicrobiales bacterium AG-410-I20]|nr:MAG: Uncharacterised protein [Acidimicrobiales bacterium AG-410-I20]
MLILLGLAVLWAAVLLPPILRRNTRRTVLRPPLALAGAHQTSGWQAIQKAAKEIPNSAQAAKRRRRDVLLALIGIAIMTLLFAFAVGSIMWMIHFLADVALVGYATLLTLRNQKVLEGQDVVVPFRPASPLVPDTGIAMRDEAVLRRQAN